MNITLKPLTVEDWFGRKHVRGVYVSQEIFQADLLNRTLVTLHAERGHDTAKTTALLWYLWDDAMTNPLLDEDRLLFGAQTRAAYTQCVAAQHTVAALSLLRQVRMEALMYKQIALHFSRDVREKAQHIMAGYRKETLRVDLHINGVYAMSGEDLLAHTHDMYWYFNEFLNVPYMVDAGLLDTARLTLATCYSMKELEQLRSDITDKPNMPVYQTQLRDELDDWRTAYLMRQIQFIFIELTGYSNGQFGMSRTEARAFLHREF